MFAVLGELGLRDAGIFVTRCTVGIAHPFRSVFLGPVDRTIQGRLPISRRLHYPSARPVRSRVRNVVAHSTPAREPVMKGVGLLAWACPTCPNGTLCGTGFVGPSFFRPSPSRQIHMCDQGLARRLAWRARLSIC